MVVGKTYPMLTTEDIFKKYNEVDIAAQFFGIREIPCCINSPLRHDSHPSFCVFLDNDNHVKWLDWGTSEHGDLIGLFCLYWNCSFTEAVAKLYNSLVTPSTIQTNKKKVKVFTKQEKDKLSKIEVKVRPWQQYDYDYWASYGVSKKALEYAEIYPISHKIVTKIDPDTGQKSRYVFGADKYAYIFVERKENRLQIKIYQPFNTKGYKWCSKMDASVVALWTKVPQTGERIVICSSVKDALCIWTQLGIPTLALQGEGYDMSDTAINELKKRYKKVYIAFDMDTPGINDSKKLAIRTGFTSVFPDLGKNKDFSDYYKSLTNKLDFQLLKQYFK